MMYQAKLRDLLATRPQPESALQKLGELYRNEQGLGVWRIRDLDGNVVHEDVGSDHDAEWLANSATGGCDFADLREDS